MTADRPPTVAEAVEVGARAVVVEPSRIWELQSEGYRDYWRRRSTAVLAAVGYADLLGEVDVAGTLAHERKIERDALAATVARVEALVTDWEGAQIENREALFRREFLPRDVPGPEQFRAALHPTEAAHLRVLPRERYDAALDSGATEGWVTDHDFLPVNGHPDDDECTYRNDGTDLTYCGEPKDTHRDASDAAGSSADGAQGDAEAVRVSLAGGRQNDAAGRAT